MFALFFKYKNNSTPMNFAYNTRWKKSVLNITAARIVIYVFFVCFSCTISKLIVIYVLLRLLITFLRFVIRCSCYCYFFQRLDDILFACTNCATPFICTACPSLHSTYVRVCFLYIQKRCIFALYMHVAFNVDCLHWSVLTILCLEKLCFVRIDNLFLLMSI